MVYVFEVGNRGELMVDFWHINILSTLQKGV